MTKASYTLPPPVHFRERAARFLKLIPIAAFLAASFAPQAWADSGGDTFTIDSSTWYIGTSSGTTGSDNKGVTVTNNYPYAAGGYSNKSATIPGIEKSDTANYNELTIDSGGAVDYAHGGRTISLDSLPTATENELTIKGTVNEVAYGGSCEGSSGEATDNTVTLAGGGTVKTVYGGYAPNVGTATLNKVIIEKGTVTGTVYGGYGSSSATYNKVTIEKDGTAGSVIGGLSSGSGVATNNTVTLAGGTVTGPVYGGLSGSGNAVTGNTLAVKGEGSSVGDSVEKFETLDFTLPADIADGGKMLNVTGAAQFVNGGSTYPVEVKLAFDGAPTALNKGTIKLITSSYLKIALKNKTATATTAGGNYEFALDASDNKNLIATLQKVTYTITATATPTAGGGINCDYTSVEVGSGTTVTCTLNVNEGYEVSSFSVVGDVDQSGCGDPCVLKDIASHVDVSVEFVKVHKVSGAESEGGKVECLEAEVVDDPSIEVTCEATANDGFEFVGSMTVKGTADTPICSGKVCTIKGIKSDITVTGSFKATGGGGGGSFAPAVLSIDGNTSNTAQLQPGKANAVQFTLGAPFEGYGTLKITGVTKSLQKASLDSETVNIVDGKFTANITPEKGEKTVTVNLTVKDTPVNKDFTFTVAGSGGAVTGTASPVPTLGEVGLLLSGIALAGAAAPALRRRERRERKERKQD